MKVINKNITLFSIHMHHYVAIEDYFNLKKKRKRRGVEG